MNSFPENYKRWTNLIQNLNFEDVIKEVKDLKTDPELDRHIFKMLLRLCHSADHCRKNNLSKEKEIYTLSALFCSILKSPPDLDKYLSAMYFILEYLLVKSSYRQANSLCNYVLPGNFIKELPETHINKYNSLCTMWHQEIIVYFSKKLSTESLPSEILETIEIHFELLKCCYASKILKSKYTLEYIFYILKMYIKELISLSLSDKIFSSINKIFNALAQIIKKNSTFKIQEVYEKLLVILNNLFFQKSNDLKNSCLREHFKIICSNFNEYFKKESVCYYNYKFFIEYGSSIIESKNVIDETIIKTYSKKLERLVKDHGEKNTITPQTVLIIFQSFDTTFSLMENLTNKKKFMEVDMLLQLCKFLKSCAKIRANREFSCKTCSKQCKVTKDIYYSALPATRLVKIISKSSELEMTEELLFMTESLINDGILISEELEKLSCKNGINLWDSCGRNIFNIGLVVEKKFPKTVENLYKKLLSKILQHDGINSKTSSFGLDNPISSAIHRLSMSTFYQGKYKETMRYAAYSLLLTQDPKKTLKYSDIWACAKEKLCSQSIGNIHELTMVKCLQTELKFMNSLGFILNLDDFNLLDICLKEIQALYISRTNFISSIKAILLEMEKFPENNTEYVKGTMFLCFHVLNFSKRNSISQIIVNAIAKVKKSKLDLLSSRCLLTNLKFFTVIEKMFIRTRAISAKIDQAEFTLKNFKVNEIRSDIEDEDNVLPTYGGVNIQEDYKCVKELQKIIEEWDQFLPEDAEKLANLWEPKLTLEAIVICCEYLRLYNFRYCEETGWKLAYKVATTINDYCSYIYITSRALSMRMINESWLSRCQNKVEILSKCEGKSEINIVALFWLSLADFYCSCEMFSEAKLLLQRVRNLPNFRMTVNSKMYLYYSNIKFQYFYILNPDASHSDYTRLSVEVHYSMISVHDIINEYCWKVGEYRFKLLSYEFLFESLNKVLIPVNNLVSFREISPHLNYALKMAQKLGMTLRIANILKNWCFINLLRTRTDECESNLSDLEHILGLDQIFAGKSVKTNNTETGNSSRHQNKVFCSSPEFKRKKFISPECMNHTNYCQCFMCSNVAFLYQIFNCIHVRAQLFVLLNFPKEAEGYFAGAARVKSKIDVMDNDDSRKYTNFKWKTNATYVIDFISYLMNYAMYIIEFQKENLASADFIIKKALEICQENNFQMDCTTCSVHELQIQQEFHEIFRDKLSFELTDIKDIPIIITNETSCIKTPRIIVKTNTSDRRGRRQNISPVCQPPPQIVFTNLHETTDVLVPPNSAEKLKKSSRGVRRKILEEYSEDNDKNTENKQEEKNKENKLNQELAKPRRVTRSSSRVYNQNNK